MAVAYNSSIITNSLTLCLDAANLKSYDRYENLLTNSSSTAAWNSGTFTTETTNRILGLNTVRITDLTSDGDAPYLNGTTIPVGTYTVSHYVDTINSTSTSFTFSPFTFHANSGGFTYSYASSTFTLSTKSFSAITYYGPAWSNASTSAVDLGNGIYRVSITATTSLAGTGIRAYLTPSPQDTTYLLVAGSQYETSLTATDYYATSGTVKNRGTTWTNLSSSGNNGTLTNGPTYNSSNGGSLVFDGADDFSTSGALSGSYSSFTVIVWFYPTSVTNYENPIDCNYSYNGTTGNIGPRLEMNSSGTLAWNYSNDTANNNNFYSHNVVSSGLAANTWHCVSITYNGGSNSSITYYNGNATGLSRSVYGTPTGFIGVMNNVIVGKGFHLGGAERIFTGRVSNVLIYNRVLSATEIQQNFNATRGRFGI